MRPLLVRPARKGPGPESALLSSALALLARLPGVFVWRNNTGAVKMGDRFVAFGRRGSADILGVVRAGTDPAPVGVFLAIETKAPRGRVTPEQQAFGEDVRRMGGVYVVARTIDDVRQAVDEARARARRALHHLQPPTAFEHAPKAPDEE